jgi:DNA-binding protein
MTDEFVYVPATGQQLVDIFLKAGGKTIDTARQYANGTSEKFLAQLDVKAAHIDTKQNSSPLFHWAKTNIVCTQDLCNPAWRACSRKSSPHCEGVGRSIGPAQDQCVVSPCPR